MKQAPFNPGDLLILPNIVCRRCGVNIEAVPVRTDDGLKITSLHFVHPMSETCRHSGSETRSGATTMRQILYR